ncbi:MAG: pilus assembly protein PilM [Armatimonadota bacterium]
MSLFGKSAPSAVVGLDIGTELIKAAEAKLTKDGIRITGLGVMPTPPGVIDNSMIIDPKALGAAIKQLLRDSGIKTKHVVSSITGQTSVVVRIIEVPRMTPGELAETMKWEVERHVPFAPTEIQMDFAPIEKPNTPPDAQNMEVLLAVAQQDSVNGLVQAILAAGLEPIAIDVQALAVSRPLIDAVEGPKPYITAIANIGASTTDVGVFEGSLLAFPGPPLPIAGINFTRAISEELGISMEEAEQLKKEYAEVDMTVMQGGNANDGNDDANLDFANAAPAAMDSSYYAPAADSAPNASEPTSYGTSLQQADSDFSPFDIGTPEVPPLQPEEKKLDISGDDVFDLGGQQETTDFKPVFDLEEPEIQPAVPAPASTSFDFDIEDPQTAPVQPAQPADSQFAAPAAEPDLVPAPAAPAGDVRFKVIKAITPVLIELATEIRRSIDYYTSRYQTRPEHLYLCGGTAKIHKLDQFLANELGIPVVIADPTANLTMQCPKYTPDYLSEVSSLFPVSIGLAIREMLE